MAEPVDDRFNVGARFVQISGRGGNKDYLPVQARIDWFRHDYPEGIIEQDLVFHDDKQAIFKSTVTKIRDGVIEGRADGYGQEYASAFPDYLLKAATVSIGRALNALGFGGSDLDEGVAEGNIADAPVDRPTGRGATNAPTPINAAPSAGTSRQGGYAPRVTNGKPLTEKQFGKIGVECAERGVDDDARHALLNVKFGVPSRNDLTSQQASTFIDWLVTTPPEQIAEAVGRVKRDEAIARRPIEMRPPDESPGRDEDGVLVAWTPAWKRLRELGCENKLQWEGLVEKAWPAEDPQAAVTLYEQAKTARDSAIDGEAGADRFTR